MPKTTKAALQKYNDELLERHTLLYEALKMLTRQAEDREVLAVRNGDFLPTWGMPKGHTDEGKTVTEYAREVLTNDG